MDAKRVGMSRKGIEIAMLVAMGATAALACAQGAQTAPDGTLSHPAPPSGSAHSGPPAGQTVDAATAPVKISFSDKSAEWTVSKIAELPHQTITVHNAHINADQTFSGVPLIQLLTPLGVPEKPKGKDFKLYVLVEGRDGYKVVFAIGEIAPDVHDGTVLLADTVDGKPIAENGPIQLVCTGEKRPARWVRNVAAIRVLAAD
jgi:hypothetical protein